MSLVVPLQEIFSSERGLLSRHETWVRVELEKVCKVVNGFPFKSSKFTNTAGFPIIRIRDLTKNETKTYYDGDVPDEFIVNSGDLLVGMDGIFGCYEWAGQRAGLNQRVCKLVPDEAVLLKRFLLYGINGYLTAIQNATSSVTVGHLSSRDILKIPFPLPPVAEQQKIVNKLDYFMSKSKQCQERLAQFPRTLKRFRQSVLAAACSGRLTADWREKHLNNEPIENSIEKIRLRRLEKARTSSQRASLEEIYEASEESDSSDLPDNWRYVSLKKLCESFDYGTSSKSSPVGKVPVLRMGNIQNGKLDWSDLVYTSDESDIAKYALQPGTVLFNRTNSPELVGKTTIYRGERPAIFAGYLIRINNCPELDSEYLNLCLNTNYAKAFCLEVKTDGVSQSNINAQKLGAFEVPFCSLAEQQLIVRRVSELFAFSDQLEARYGKAKRYFDKLTPSLLAKAFRGELVPQDPNDEPASALLERIHQQVAESPAPRKRKSKS